MKKNKNLDKILSNNTFLIHGGICIVLFILMCSFGVNTPIKKTYSEHVSKLTKEDYSCSLGGNVLMTKEKNGTTYTLDRPVCYLYEVVVNNTGIGYDVGTQLLYKNQCETYLEYQNKSSEISNYMYDTVGMETGCYYYADLKQYSVTLIDEHRNSLQKCYEWSDDNMYCEEYSTSDDQINFTHDGVSLDFTDDYYFRVEDDTIVKWNTKADGSGTSYNANSTATIDSNITLYAIHQYTIKLIDDSNTLAECTSLVGDKMCSCYSEEFKKNLEIEPINNKITLYNQGVYYKVDESKDNLLGWSTTNDNTIEYEIDKTITLTDNMTLYTVWEKEVEASKEYTVTFDSNGGSAVASQTILSGGTATKPSNPTKSGYTFKGWNLNESEYNFSSKVTSDITLVAQWETEEVELEINKYTYDDKHISINVDTTLEDMQKNITLTSDAYSLEFPDKIATGKAIKILNPSGATYKEYNVIVLGDLDGNGEITTVDFNTIYNYWDGSGSLSENARLAADINQSGEVTTADYNTIYNYFIEN